MFINQIFLLNEYFININVEYFMWIKSIKNNRMNYSYTICSYLIRDRDFFIFKFLCVFRFCYFVVCYLILMYFL